MTSRKLLWSWILITAILIGVMLGCSEKTFTSSSISVADNASPTAYLPLEQGWRISYVVLEPETQYFDVEVTDPVSIDHNAGYTIRKTDRNTGEIDLSYKYVKGNAIFESFSTSEPGARILESPFVIGNSWDRFDTTTTTSTIIPGQDGDIDLPGKGFIDIDGDLLKVNPGDDYSIMSIVGFEDVTAMDGKTYGHCLKVEWQTSEFSYSYFWYAPGIGLIKFENINDGLSVGEDRFVSIMSDFRHVEY